MTGTLREDQYTFLSYLAQLFLEWKMFPTKVVEKIESHIFYSENRAVYEIIWTNSVERGRSRMAIWRTSISRWMPKATNIHSHKRGLEL